MLLSMVEVARQDQLQSYFIRRRRQSKSDTRLNVRPFGAVIENAPKLVGLLAGRVEIVQRTDVRILFDGQRPFGREIVCDARRGREVEALEAAGPRIVEDRIHDEIPRAQVHAEDRPDLRSERSRIPTLGVVAEFEVHPVYERVFRRVRLDEQQAQLAAIDRCAAVLRDAVERQIKSRFDRKKAFSSSARRS